MKVNPQQAPLYGTCVLAVQLSDEELAQVGDVEGVEFYLLFSGSRQTHLSTTLRDSHHGSLQATCPAHDCCESVLLMLYAVRPGGGTVEEVGQTRLQFVQDLAFDMAQYLVSTVGRADGLDGILMLDECQIPLQECERLDHSLALALRHLHLPDGWNLLGDHLGKDTDPEPQETLLHFACGRGLLRVASFLLHQRGALEALRLPNKDGYTPASLAQSRGHQHILELFNREGVVKQESEAVSECHLSSGDGVLEHHPVLGTYTLSLSTHTRTLTHPEPGTGHPSLQKHLQQLGHLIQRHIEGQSQHDQGGACVQRHEQLENKPEQPELKLECVSESERTGSDEPQQEEEECVQECRGAGGGECLKSDEEARVELEQHDPLSPTHEQQAADTADNDNVESSGEDTHSHTHKSPAREHTLSSEQEEEELSGEHGAPRVRPQPRPPLVSTETSSLPTAEGQNNQAQDGQEEECVCEYTERDSDSSPPATTTTEEKLGEEEDKEVHTGIEEEEVEKKEEEEENTGLEESGITPPDTTDAVTLPDNNSDPPEELSPGEGPQIGELSGQSAGEEADKAPGIICSALGGSKGGRREGDDRGRDEEEEEEEEKLPDQKHPSGLGGLADTAETRETAESPETAETAVGSGDTEPADETTAAATVTTDMGLTQSLQDLESSDTDSRDCSHDAKTGRDEEDEGEGEKHKHEAQEEEEGESREENEEFVDASSTSVEAENSLFLDCSDSVPEATTHPSPQHEDASLQEQAVSPQPRSPDQIAMDDGSHEELSHEAEVEAGQTAISTRPVDGGVETETPSPRDHCSDSTEATLSEEVESAGEQHKDGVAKETFAGSDVDCDGDITSPVSDSGCDIPSLATDPDVTSLNDTVEGSSDTHLHDSTETDPSEPLSVSVDTEEDLDIPECQVETLCETAETEQEVRGEEQDQEQQPSLDTPDAPEMAEGEPHSDASVTHSEDSRPASSDDTLEGLDEDSSTMSESEPQKQDVRGGQGDAVEGEGTQEVSDAQVGEAPVPDASDAAGTSDGIESGKASAGPPDNNASHTLSPEVAMDTETVFLSDAMVAAEEEPPAEGVSHTHTHARTLAHTDSGDKRQPKVEQRSHLSECEGVETAAVCEPEETHALVEQGEVTTPKFPSEDSSPEQVSEQVTAGVIGGVTEAEVTPLATQALEVPAPVETTQEVPEEVVEEVTNVEQQDSSTDEALSVAGEHVNSDRQVDVLTAAGALDCMTYTQSRVGQTHSSPSPIHREKESFPAAPDTHTHTLTHRGLEKGTSIDSTDSPQSSRSSISTLQRDSGSDTDGFCSTDTGEDNVFRKGDDTVTGDSTSEVSVSCSSTDDAASLGHPSSTSSSSSSSSSSRLLSGDITRRLGAGGGVSGGVDTEEEAKDCVSDVPLRSALLRSSIRSLSPFRRHSWGPGKDGITDGDMNQRSALPSYGDQKPASHRRSLSLEGLAAADGTDGKAWHPHQNTGAQHGRRVGRQESEERGSLVSLTEEEHESDVTDCSSLDSQKSRRYQPMRRSSPAITLPLTKSVSMLAISQRDVDGLNSFSSTTGSVDYSITEEEPGPLRGDFEGKSGTKVSRTFSYLKNKMYKKTREKDKDRHKEREKETKEKRINGHSFSHVGSVQPTMCPQCHRGISSKEAFVCSSCYVCVHKGCRESLPVCAKVKMKMHKQQPFAVPDSATLPTVTLRPKSSGSRERPRSAIMSPDEQSVLTAPRRHTLMPFNSSNLSKSISISNIAGPVFDEIPLRGLRYLSQSTDSLHKPSKVNESTESLVDEGTDMIDSQLMGEFEADARELEADSWSFTVDKKYLKQLKKDSIKRQDVIYELMQTEMHHVRTLRVMAEVYCKGLQKEVQLELQTLERMFPMLDELLDIHTHFLSSLLERKRGAPLQGAGAGGFLIERIGDLLINQFSGSNADSMKRVYGKFCGRHNEAVNLYKEHHAKDKRFQAFIRKKMSSSIVRRMGIPECILLVTQRITKYPVLLQRILQHTRENEEDHAELSQALGLVKEVIVAVDLRVSEQEKRRRLKEIHARTDSKSIMRMKSGQMFAREDLLRGRRLLHDGPLQLKNATGRLKDVQALLLSDILVFLQEKDQKYVFASLDQRSTVISLQKLIVREVANEERALFLITAGMERPEMVEVHASSKDERNTWMQLLQNAMQSIEKDEDEGIPSETEEDKRLMESKAKELREVLKKKDDQIVNLLQEKMKLFRDMCDCGPTDDGSSCSKMLFRACNEEVPKGEPIMKDALKEVETLQLLVNGSLGGAVGQQVAQEAAGGVGPVTLPRRAETFGGFDSHQMNISKNGDREDGEDTADLRRTESDSVLKKGGNANLLLLLKRNSEQVLHSVTNLHDLLASLQAVVVQQDTFIEDQRQALSERPSSSASCSSSASASASSSRPSSRPNSLIEQERQRSLEKQRQEAAALQRQQAAHAEEKRRRERQWEAREGQLAEREASTQAREEELHRRRRELEQARLELQAKKEDYQRDLERLRDGQRRLQREKDNLHREAEALEQLKMERCMQRTPSSTSEDSLQFQSGISSSLDPPEASDSDPPRKNSLSRLEPKPKGRTLNPFSLNSGSRSQSGENQIPSRLLQLTKSKDKKDKKKKKSKHPLAPDSQLLPLTEPTTDGEIYFC